MEWTITSDADKKTKEFLNEFFKPSIEEQQRFHKDIKEIDIKQIYEFFLCFAIGSDKEAASFFGCYFDNSDPAKNNIILSNAFYFIQDFYAEHSAFEVLKEEETKTDSQCLAIIIFEAIEYFTSHFKQDVRNGDAMVAAQLIDDLVYELYDIKITDYFPKSTVTKKYDEHAEYLELVESSGENSNFGCEIM